MEARLTGDSYDLPDEALAAAIARASEDDVIVCGFFVIAEISGYSLQSFSFQPVNRRITHNACML